MKHYIQCLPLARMVGYLARFGRSGRKDLAYFASSVKKIVILKDLTKMVIMQDLPENWL